MSSFRNALVLGAALSALLLGAQAQAATASASISGGASQSMTGPGFATAQVTGPGGFAQANSYEFKKGLGLSGFTAGSGMPPITTFARANAAYSDNFRVIDTSGLAELGDATFFLPYTVVATGEVSSSNSAVPSNPSARSQAAAKYDYRWDVDGVVGVGHVQSDKLTNGRVIDIRNDAPTGAVLIVRLGDLVNVNFTASLEAGVFAFGFAGASATADFSHTLRWGGINGITAQDTAGNAIDLPDGFRLSLMSDTTGSDYWTPAGPNPFTSAVPEPASWALMILGFAGVGGLLRRRRGGHQASLMADAGAPAAT